MNASDRDLLRRYGSALGLQNHRDDLLRCSTRFRQNHAGHIDNALDARMVKVFEAHRQRVAGLSSPADCDQALKEAAA